MIGRRPLLLLPIAFLAAAIGLVTAPAGLPRPPVGAAYDPQQTACS